MDNLPVQIICEIGKHLSYKDRQSCRLAAKMFEHVCLYYPKHIFVFTDENVEHYTSHLHEMLDATLKIKHCLKLLYLHFRRISIFTEEQGRMLKSFIKTCKERNIVVDVECQSCISYQCILKSVPLDVKVSLNHTWTEFDINAGVLAGRPVRDVELYCGNGWEVLSRIDNIENVENISVRANNVVDLSKVTDKTSSIVLYMFVYDCTVKDAWKITSICDESSNMFYESFHRCILQDRLFKQRSRLRRLFIYGNLSTSPETNVWVSLLDVLPPQTRYILCPYHIDVVDFIKFLWSKKITNVGLVCYSDVLFLKAHIISRLMHTQFHIETTSTYTVPTKSLDEIYTETIKLPAIANDEIVKMYNSLFKE
jgi:hypothetical protein